MAQNAAAMPISWYGTAGNIDGGWGWSHPKTMKAGRTRKVVDIQ